MERRLNSLRVRVTRIGLLLNSAYILEFQFSQNLTTINMKSKILLFSLLCISFLSTAFAFDVDKVDSLLNTIYHKVDILNKKNPTIIGKLKNALWVKLSSETNLEKSYIYAQILRYIQSIEVTKITAQEMSDLKKNTYVLWDTKAKISIFEFSDLECPYCKKQHDAGIIKNILALNSDTNYIFKHFPLSFHESALPRALWVECVGKLGWKWAFYDMIDAYFSQTNTPTDDVFKKWKIDAKAYTSCLADSKVSEIVNASISQGETLFAVQGTPTTVIINNETLVYKTVVWAVWISEFIDAIKKVSWK